MIIDKSIKKDFNKLSKILLEQNGYDEEKTANEINEILICLSNIMDKRIIK